jgi:NADH dehydrogenase (ubiquinone) 1 alpha subcomplex subunit 12
MASSRTALSSLASVFRRATAFPSQSPLLSNAESVATVSTLTKFVEESAITAPSKRKGSHVSPAPPLLKTLLDGKMADVVYSHGPGGTFVGEDYNGNRYFERKDGQAGRSRWVVYSGAAHHYENQNPTTVPPEWHSWLHYISDENPVNTPGEKKPVFHIAAAGHPSYEKEEGVEKYQPKGAWAWNSRKGGGRRNWRKFEAWTP